MKVMDSVSHWFNLFKHQHIALIEMVKPLSNEFIMNKGDSEKWSIHENLAHLARYQEVFEFRMSKVLDKDNPNLERYQAENDPAFHYWIKFDTQKILKELYSKRIHLIDFLENLSNQEMNRKGKHPHFGLLKMQDWVQFFVLHESHHIYTIFRIIKANQK